MSILMRISISHIEKLYVLRRKYDESSEHNEDLAMGGCHHTGKTG